jgi:hypothetical protein
MYNVHVRRYTAAAVRERLAEALDEAESGRPVIIERNRVRFRLSLEAERPRLRRRRPVIEILDPAVAEGRWTWAWGREGLKFRGKRRP